jgi:hypothetical protein
MEVERATGRMEIETLVREIECAERKASCEDTEKQKEISESVLRWEAKRFARAKSPEEYRADIAQKKAESVKRLTAVLLQAHSHDKWPATSQRVGALLNESWGILRMAPILVPEAYDMRYGEELKELFKQLKGLSAIHAEPAESVGFFIQVVTFHGKMRWYRDQIMERMAPDPLTFQEVLEIEGGCMAGPAESVAGIHKHVLKRVAAVMHECWNVFRVIHTTFPHPDDASVMELVRKLFSDLRSITDTCATAAGVGSVFVQVARLRYRISQMIARIQHHFGSVPITLHELLASENDPFYFLDRVALSKEKRQVIGAARDMMWKI